MILQRTMDDAIFALTGLVPEFTDGKNSYTITLGTVDPFKLEKAILARYSKGEHYYALRLTLLESVVQLMQSPDNFERWVNKNKPKDDS